MRVISHRRCGCRASRSRRDRWVRIFWLLGRTGRGGRNSLLWPYTYARIRTDRHTCVRANAIFASRTPVLCVVLDECSFLGLVLLVASQCFVDYAFLRWRADGRVCVVCVHVQPAPHVWCTDAVA
eukprot:1489202-Prymnesium_polylepis.2